MPEDTPIAEQSPALEATLVGDHQKHRRRSRQRALFEWGAILIVAVSVSFFMRAYALQTFFIPSGSMEPTLQIGDRIIVSKLSLDFGSIHRGDILVFKAPPAEHCGEVVTDLVKRVIGLPGDTLTSQGNTIFVNGQSLKETWTHYEPLSTPITKTVVPPNQYFMMGDNHPNSCDSRMWGTVPRSDIIGRAFLRIWPLSRAGLL